MAKICAVVPAAGRGLRMGHEQPKQFLELSGRPILSYTLEAVSRVQPAPDIILVVPKDCIPQAQELVSCHKRLSANGTRLQQPNFSDRRLDPQPAQQPGHTTSQQGAGITIVAGGVERQDSIYNALRVLPEDCEWVLIHDGVRPFVTLQLLQKTLHAAQQTGAAIAAIPVTDTVKRVRQQHVVATLSRDEIWLVQTPQVFRKEIILQAYRAAQHNGWSGTDDAFFVEQLNIPVHVVPGERSNLKITTPEDLGWGAWLLEHSRQ